MDALLTALRGVLPIEILVTILIAVQVQIIRELRRIAKMTEDLYEWHDVQDPRDPTRKLWWLPSDELNHRTWVDEQLRRIRASVDSIERVLDSARRRSSSSD